MESVCIDRINSTKRSLCILRLVGPDLHPTVSSFLGKRKSSFVARRIASKLMRMGYILPSQWHAVYKKAIRIDTCPALQQNIDAILSMLYINYEFDKMTLKTIDSWYYLSL